MNENLGRWILTKIESNGWIFGRFEKEMVGFMLGSLRVWEDMG